MKIITQTAALAAGLVTALAVSAQTTAAGPYYATPAWDQQIAAATRFVVLQNWGGKAVLDRETGLVWERDPLNARGANYAFGQFSDAIFLCIQSETGGRAGWRAPSISELGSLYDSSGQQSGLMLPIGHPFLNVGGSLPYWSTTTSPSVAQNAFVKGFGTSVTYVQSPKNQVAGIWCVRGPGGNAYN